MKALKRCLPVVTEEIHEIRIDEIITPCDLVRCNKYDYITDTDHPALKHLKPGNNCLSATRPISTELYIHVTVHSNKFLFK